MPDSVMKICEARDSVNSTTASWEGSGGGGGGGGGGASFIFKVCSPTSILLLYDAYLSSVRAYLYI